jgi:CRISPR/Cas system-associated exonuclease Cas4 (RecB family)
MLIAESVPRTPTMPGSWRENLSLIDSLLEKKEFRHGARAISASSIGTQFFCEMKVEQAFVHGEIETEEKAEGGALHEELLAMKPTTRRRLLDDITERKLVIASFPLAAEAFGLVLVGVPDAVVFQDGRPTHVVELKTTRGNASVLYDGQRAQTVIYGLLLDQVGFDCSGLRLVVVKFRRQAPLSDEQKGQFLGEMTQMLVSGKDLGALVPGNEGQLVPHSFAYRRNEAIGILSQTQGYWLGQRSPQSTVNPNKCRACEFADICPASLAKNRRP